MHANSANTPRIEYSHAEQVLEILKQSYWAEDSSMEDVYREAVRVSEYFGHDEDMSELLELIRRAGHWIE